MPKQAARPLPPRRSIDTPIAPPIGKQWTVEAPGKIEKVSASDGKVMVMWGATGWDFLEAATGAVTLSIAKGPRREPYNDYRLLPGGDSVWLARSQSKVFVWYPATNVKQFIKGWHFHTILEKTLILRDGYVLKKFINGELVDLPDGNGGCMRISACSGDPLWCQKDWGEGEVTVTVFDPLSHEVYFRRQIPFRSVQPVLGERLLALNCETGPWQSIVEVVDFITGQTVWKRDYREPEYKGKGAAIGGIFGDRLVQLGENDQGISRRYIFDLKTERYLWHLDTESTLCHVSGPVAWLTERPLGGVDSSHSTDFDLVARRLESGGELWRGRGLANVLLHEGRVYTWKGRKLTCWQPGSESSGAAAEAPAESGAKDRRKKGVKNGGPADEATWRDLMYAAASKDPDEALLLGPLLELLRKRFADVRVLPSGLIGVYDGADNFWGSLSVSKRLRGPRKYTYETRVLGLDVVADESVIDCVNTALKKARLDWDVLD